MLKGGWWWKSCGRGLNGIYLTNPQDLTARQGSTTGINSSSPFANLILRHRLVPMARMGLHAQAIANDDSTQELEKQSITFLPVDYIQIQNKAVKNQ